MQANKKKLLEALKASMGIVKTACEKTKISRDTHYRWLKEDDQYRLSVESVQDIALDIAESALFKQIKNGNTAATIFYLKTKGKKRGYIESQNLDHTTGGKEIKLPIISFEWPDDDE